MKQIWTGRVLSGFAAVFMAWDGAFKLTGSHHVTESMQRLGYPDIATALGLTELACTALYLFPRTRNVGALLLTGFLGGAVATHVRVGDPFFFPFIVGAFIWGGLILRDRRLAALAWAQ